MRSVPRSVIPDEPDGYSVSFPDGVATFQLATNPVQAVTVMATTDTLQFYPERSAGHRMIMNLLGVA